MRDLSLDELTSVYGAGDSPTPPSHGGYPPSRGSKGRGSKGRGSKGRGSKGRGSKGRGSKGRGTKRRGSKRRRHY